MPTTTKTRRTRKAKTTKQTVKRSPKALDPAEYRGYIKSTAWKKKKRYYWSRCKDKSCRGCGIPWESGFNLHHVTYVRLGIERLADLMPLCDKCHRMLHQHQISNSLCVEEATKQFIRSMKKVRDFNNLIPEFKE
jgi:5-methylcytosine-specific restriction endonuclease McrA